jgi:hypothetical protein
MKRPPRKAACSFTEPVSLSSTLPGNLSLAGTAPGSRFDLLALRARCKSKPRGPKGTVQGVRRTTGCNLRTFLCAATNWMFCQYALLRPRAARRQLGADDTRSRDAESQDVHGRLRRLRPGLRESGDRGRRHALGPLQARETAQMKRPPRKAACSFTEPVSLSSTLPGNLSLAGTAPGSRFDLLALRARCKTKPRGRKGTAQEVPQTTGCNLRTFLFAPIDSPNLQHATETQSPPEGGLCIHRAGLAFVHAPRKPFPQAYGPAAASLYSRSVLGARGTVGRRLELRKRLAQRRCTRIAHSSFRAGGVGFFQRTTTHREACRHCHEEKEVRRAGGAFVRLPR